MDMYNNKPCRCVRGCHVYRPDWDATVGEIFGHIIKEKTIWSSVTLAIVGSLPLYDVGNMHLVYQEERGEGQFIVRWYKNVVTQMIDHKEAYCHYVKHHKVSESISRGCLMLWLNQRSQKFRNSAPTTFSYCTVFTRWSTRWQKQASLVPSL